MKENFFFTRGLDLRICSLWQVVVIALLHRFLFVRKYCYMRYYPAFSEIAAAYLAHKSFYLYRLAVWIKRLIKRLLNR